MSPIKRLCSYWVYGGFISSFLFLGLLIAYSSHLSLIEILFCLHLPVYMWHQYEEHDDDRFKKFLDRTFFENILTPQAIFVINVFGVWFVFSVLILLSLFSSLGFGLGMTYLCLINAFSHIVSALKSRSYNPGLLTSLLLFIPLSGYTLVESLSFSQISLNYHLIGLLVGLGIHVLIIVYVLMRRKKR